MIKKSLLLLTAVIMGASSLTYAANITVTNKDKNTKTGPKGSTIYVKVGSTVKSIAKGKSQTFTLPSSSNGFAITASKTYNSNTKKLTGTIYSPGSKLSYSTVKSKPKVQIDVTNKKVTASK
jgi:hypothetical protein